MKHIQKIQITMFLQPLSHFLQYVFKQFMSSFLCHLKFVGKVRLKMKEYMKNRKHWNISKKIKPLFSFNPCHMFFKM